MKSVFGVLVLMMAMSAQALAMDGAETFSITSANFAKGHFDAELDHGTVTIDSVENTVTIRATGYKFGKCPENAMCILGSAMQKFEVILPIISQEISFCGDVIIAQMDRRPVDGGLDEIVLTDYRHMMCKLGVPGDAVLTYRTAFYSRVEHRLIEIKSTFVLDQPLGKN